MQLNKESLPSEVERKEVPRSEEQRNTHYNPIFKIAHCSPHTAHESQQWRLLHVFLEAPLHL